MTFPFVGIGLQSSVLQYVTNIFSSAALDLDFTTGGALNSKVTYTRASSAIVVRSSGYMDDVAPDVARLDYDPLLRNCKGLLIEKASSNVLLYSEQFSKPNWAVSNCSPNLGNVISSPFSAIKADLVTSSAAGAAYTYQDINAGDTSYTFSVFVKQSTSTTVKLEIYNSTAAASVATTSANISAGTPYADGWYRHSVSASSGISVGNTISFRIYTDNANTGDGTSIYVFGACAEPSTTFATSYIRTFSATATRNADSAIINGTNFSSWFNSTSGTFYAEAQVARVLPTPYSFMIEGSIGAATPSTVTIGTGGTTAQAALYVRMNTGGANTKADISHTYTAGQIVKGATAYDTAGATSGLAWNGASITANSTSSPSIADTLNLGSRTGTSNFFNGHIRRVSFWTPRLTNTQLQTITS